LFGGESFGAVRPFDNNIGVFIVPGFSEAFLADIKTEKVLTLQSLIDFDGYSENTFSFYDDVNWYFYDDHGTFMFEIKADRVEEFSNGEAQVFVGKKAGSIDRQGNWVKPLKKP